MCEPLNLTPLLPDQPQVLREYVHLSEIGAKRRDMESRGYACVGTERRAGGEFAVFERSKAADAMLRARAQGGAV